MTWCTCENPSIAADRNGKLLTNLCINCRRTIYQIGIHGSAPAPPCEINVLNHAGTLLFRKDHAVQAEVAAPTSVDDKYAGIDPGIVQIVRILAENGVETCQSCAASGPFGMGSGKQQGEAHSYPEPTVEFYGDAAAGWRALAVALEHGLPVHELRRVWSIEDGVPVGPHWAMTFFLFPANLTGWLAPDAPPYVKSWYAPVEVNP